MSRYVEIACPLTSLDEVAAGLAALGLAHERSATRVVLQGSLECVGEPVDIRLAAGILGTVEDFGFVQRDEGRIDLVCGELDRRLLEERLIVPLRRTAVERSVARMSAETGLTHERTVEPDGTLRIVLRRR